LPASPWSTIHIPGKVPIRLQDLNSSDIMGDLLLKERRESSTSVSVKEPVRKKGKKRKRDEGTDNEKLRIQQGTQGKGGMTLRGRES
jgi:hypothetical protein